MPRAQATDFYHGMKFHMRVITQGVEGASDIGAQGGFTTLSLPEKTLEVAEYKEGIYLYKRKFPGNVTFADITAAQGVAKGSTEFDRWVRAGYLGQEYRADLQIRHFHRTEAGESNNYLATQPARVINVFEGFASRVKPGSDFDANGSDISIAEIDIAYEYYELQDTGA